MVGAVGLALGGLCFWVCEEVAIREIRVGEGDEKLWPLKKEGGREGHKHVLVMGFMSSSGVQTWRGR